MNGIESVQVRELKCEYDTGNTLANRCRLANRESILPCTENDVYVFTGLTEVQRLSVEQVTFRTTEVAFVPKETYTTFPNLNTIGFTALNEDHISYDWLNNMVKSFRPQIKNIVFREYVRRVERSVMDILKNFQKVDFKDNHCIGGAYINSNAGFVPDLNAALSKNCYTNFVNKPAPFFKPVCPPSDIEQCVNATAKISEIQNSLIEKIGSVEKSLLERINGIQTCSDPTVNLTRIIQQTETNLLAKIRGIEKCSDCAKIFNEKLESLEKAIIENQTKLDKVLCQIRDNVKATSHHFRISKKNERHEKSS